MDNCGKIRSFIFKTSVFLNDYLSLVTVIHFCYTSVFFSFLQHLFTNQILILKPKR